MSIQKKVIIIGAGIGGIATASLLAKAGYDVHVYEKNERPGGRADILKVDGFTFDMGPSWYLMPEVFEHYFSLMDESVSEHLDLRKLNPAYKVFFEKDVRPIIITSDQAIDSATFEAIEPGSGEALRRYISRGDTIYILSLRHFLYSNFERIDDLFKKDIVSRAFTMLRLAFTPIDRYISRFVRDIRLKQILEYPMVFLGTSPFTAPAIYSLMSALDFNRGVFYPMGGMYTIIDSMVTIAKKNGVSFYYNQTVTQITTAETSVSGIMLSDQTQQTADIVISNADLHFTETSLLPLHLQSYPEKYWHSIQAGPSALLLYIGIRGKITHLEHHNLLFVDAWKENFEAIYHSKTFPETASIYLCKPSGIDPSVAPDDTENIFVLVPLPPGIPLDDTMKVTLTKQYLDQIMIMTKTPDLRERIITIESFGPNDFANKFNSWQSTALGPSHVLRQSAFFRTPNKSKKVSNLYYVGGSTTPGIGLPMCLISAELVYKRLARDSFSGPVGSVRSIGSAK